MSQPYSHDPQPEFFDYKHVGGRFLGLIGMAVLAFAVVLVGAFIDTRQFAFSYLFAYTFFLTICMGGLFWTLVHHATDAEWSVVVRRQLENMGSLLAIMALLFIPLLAVGPTLWKWMQPESAHSPLLAEKAASTLNVPFFYIRASVYSSSLSLPRRSCERSRSRRTAVVPRFTPSSIAGYHLPAPFHSRSVLLLPRWTGSWDFRYHVVFHNVGRVYFRRCGA